MGICANERNTAMDDKQLLDALRDVVKEETAHFATKTDMEKFVTKEDAKDFATKADLENFPTKEDAKSYATKADLENFPTKEDAKNYATKADLEKFVTKEDAKNFATKDDLERFATKEDLERFATKEDLEEKDRRLHILIENSMSRIENLLREDYGRVAGAAAKVADYDEVKGKVDTHQTTLENHNRRLVELEKKVI